MVAGVSSATVTEPFAWLNAPDGSVAVSRTAAVPSAYGDAGTWSSVMGSPSASNEPSSIDASATQALFAAMVTLLAFAIGGWLGGRHVPTHAPDIDSVYEAPDAAGSTGRSCTSTANVLLPAGRSNEYVSGRSLD